MGLIQRFKNFILTPTTPLEMIYLDRPKSEWKRLYDYSALFSIAYLACEQTKARSIGALPVGVYRKEGKNRERVPHVLGDLLSGQANDLMSGRDLRHWAMLRRDTFGNAYIRIEWVRGMPVALWPVTSSVTPDYDSSARPGYRVRYIVGGDKYNQAGTYFANEIINLRTSMTKDGLYGQSIAELAAHEIGLSVDLEQFYSSMLHNGNHQLGHVELPTGRVTKEEKESLNRAVEAKSGIENAGKAPIFIAGAKWVNDTQSMRDASVIEQQTWILEQVCRACNVPPWMVYDTSSGNGKYENAEAARVDYVTNTLLPDVTDFEGAFNGILRAMGEQDLYVKLDLNGLMRGDKAAQGQYYREMIYSMVYSPNEVRAFEDMNPFEGGDRHLVPVNYGLMEADGTVTFFNNDGIREPADGSQTGVAD